MTGGENERQETLAFVEIVIESGVESTPSLPRMPLKSIAQEYQAELKRDIERVVRLQFGDKIRISEIEIHDGSVVLLFLLLGHIYEFMESPPGKVIMGALTSAEVAMKLWELGHHLNKAIRHFFTSHQAGPVSVSSVASPNPKIWMVRPTPAFPDTSKLLLGYLILSHAALLALIMWLVVTHIH